MGRGGGGRGGNVVESLKVLSSYRWLYLSVLEFSFYPLKRSTPGENQDDFGYGNGIRHGIKHMMRDGNNRSAGFRDNGKLLREEQLRRLGRRSQLEANICTRHLCYLKYIKNS